MSDNSPSRTSRHRTLRLILLAKGAAGAALTSAFLGGFWLRANGLTAGEALDELQRSPSDPPRFEWTSIDEKHWQVVASGDPEPTAQTDAREGNTLGCPGGMVRVKGSFHVEHHGEATGEMERMQDTACTDWISRDFPARCRTFDRAKIAEQLASFPTRAMDFCMDRFEYPNAAGAYPWVVVTFHEAEALCKKSNKRLCTEHEWTFACEGEEARPYPYGYERDATSCVIDRAWRPFSENALSPRDGDKARAELDRLWQAEPSGSRGGCKSPFGVYDLTGNVDEWTRSARTTGYRSILKGGYWGPVRARCRPATRAHGEEFVAYQQGFRCCSEASEEVAAPAPSPPVADLVDAGRIASVDPAGSDAGPRASGDDLTPAFRPRVSDEPDDDELGAIRRAASAPRCAGSPLAPAGRTGIAIGVALAALVARRRRA